MRACCGALALVALLALSSGAAGAGGGHGPKVDPLVGLEADSSSAAAALPVIVFGHDVGAARDPELSLKASLSGEEAAGTVRVSDLDRLASEPNVAYVAPDVPVAPLGSAAPVDFSALASLYPVVDNAPQAWARGLTGAGVGIAVLDSGLDQLAAFGRAGSKRVAATVGPGGGRDWVGHGTIVASVAAGQSDDGRFEGVAPGATVVSYSVASGDSVYTSDVLQGLSWVLANAQRYNLRVVNLSFAEVEPSSYATSPLDAAVEILWRQAGIVVVAAAGNGGPGEVDYAPANDPFVLSVGATDPNGTAGAADDALTPWSAWGTTGDGFAKPEIVAPGRHIVGGVSMGSELAHDAPASAWVDFPRYLAISGTSFAAPQVAGAAAVLLQEHPGWTPDQVKWVLERTARPVAGSAAGALDLAAAVAYSGTPPAANDGVAPSLFDDSTWIDALVANASATKQATWTSRQATWTAKQATWTATHQATWSALRQATWTAAGSQATWTANRQATWTGAAWGG